jgi:hypothetical protein
MRRFRQIARPALAAFFLMSAPQLAKAIIKAPEPIDSPVPDEWHASFKQFLIELGVENIEAMLSTAKAKSLGDGIVLRLEHQSLCATNAMSRCLTIIGQIKGQSFQPHAMFVAGKMMTQGDEFAPLIGRGSERPPVFFLEESDFANATNMVILRETPKGWIVIPQK